MIKSTKDNSFLTHLTDVLVVADYSTAVELKKLVKLVNENFPKGREFEFLFVVNEKKMPDMFPAFKGINYICMGDFNLLGGMKNDKMKSFATFHNFDAMLCLCWDMNKGVSKFTNSLKIKYSIGFERESLPKFDLAFPLKEKSEEQLIQLSVKYLKQL
jgi:hypothetical protein